MINIGKIIRRGAAISAVVLCSATSFVANEEGLRTSAYLDVAGVPTICYGDTENVQLGETRTKEECSALFRTKLGAYGFAVQQMVGKKMPVEVHVALTSWAYNVGLNAAAKSTLMKHAQAGNFAAACNELPKWKFAAGRPILEKRRERERTLCLKGLKNV